MSKALLPVWPARVVALCAFAALLAGCGADGAVTRGTTGGDMVLPPAWLGIETRLLEDDLVGFRVAVRHAESPRQVEDYAACAAAQYALIRGFGFARHLRTQIAQEGAVTRADAVYTISAALPRGVATIDAETTVRDCGTRGVPTV